ncbi:hypothetical protein D0859_02796 [Hortaea werneckii]|uniref:Uncharacterized protein n=1 Tax=Hortaea werneckii TaxID=91943 RepID=A0A3M7J5J9_HORWE|nr:hypothetical protein D0859_02796 [Hortaea werneckii]
MATPATARRSEPQSSTLDPDLADTNSPGLPTHHRSSRASTPRPSISPLSTASRANRSPVASREATMGDSALRNTEANTATANNGNYRAAEEDDNSSSSLSDPEDDFDDEEQQNGAEREQRAGESLGAHKSMDVDSEAETERLDQTPQKAQKQLDAVGKTPSKLSQAATAEDELSDPPSPLPAGNGVGSQASTSATARMLGQHSKGAGEGVATSEGLLGQKRKRSDSADSSQTSAASDLGESPRKRSPEMSEHQEMKTDGVDADTNGEQAYAPEEAVEEPTPREEGDTPAPPAAKGQKGRKGKPRGRKPKDRTQEHIKEQQEVAESEQEPNEETAARTEEQKQQRAQAHSLYEDLAKQFTSFREKLYDERLTGLTAELELLNKPDCQHPEYLRQVACVDARREKQIREANAYYFYRMQSVRQRTLGERSQLHSQYFQTIRELRENVLYELGEDWYNIQKERRQQHQEGNDAFIYKFPEKRTDQIRRQAEYNQEVSILSGVAKYVGFPAAPEVGGAKNESMEDDLRAMKIPKRMPHRQMFYGHQMPPLAAQNERLTKEQERIAHEQYIEQNAWAQPQRLTHHHGTPNLTHTDNWAEQPAGGAHAAARNLGRSLNAPNASGRTASPFATPLPQKRSQPLDQSSSAGTVAMGSDGQEAPSSILAAPPTSERMHTFAGSQGSPLLVNKQRHLPQQQPSQNGGTTTEGTGGWRNFSNMSGVSGTSTIDAPPDSAEKARGEWRGDGARDLDHQYQTSNFPHQQQHGRYQHPQQFDDDNASLQQKHHTHQQQQKSLPALLSEASPPPQSYPRPHSHQVFDTSQLHGQHHHHHHHHPPPPHQHNHHHHHHQLNDHDPAASPALGGRRSTSRATTRPTAPSSTNNPEIFPGVAFRREQEGSYGTPAPLQQQFQHQHQHQLNTATTPAATGKVGGSCKFVYEEEEEDHVILGNITFQNISQGDKGRKERLHLDLSPRLALRTDTTYFMPSLTINPPRPPPPPPERNTNSTPPAPPDNTSFTFSAPPPGSATFYPTVANTTTTTTTSALSNDADAIALRAAISALQFQKKKAQEDLRTLEHTKQHALKNPSQFKEALVAGKLKEERREFGGVQGILDENDSGEEGASDDEDGVGQTPAPDGEDDAMGGATEEVARKGSTNGEAPVAAGGRNTSDSAPPAPAPAQHDQEYNRSQSPTTKNPAAQQEHFPPIPGAQNVVRTPYINWEKYHILSEPLDRLHEQQRRWPGVGGISPSDQRRRRSEREYSVAAPYSPFYDRLDEGTAPNTALNRGSASGGGGVSPTSLGTGTAPAATAGAASGNGAGGASEHPMETRRGSSHRYPPPTTR